MKFVEKVNSLKIKVCGMRDSDNIRSVAALHPDYMGFILYEKSPRFVGDDYSLDKVEDVLRNIYKTGVFVNASAEYILDKVKSFDLQAVQLHGHESASFCAKLRSKGVEIVKAFQVDENFDFNSLKEYEPVCDYYLFDTRTKNYGGSGEKFDWSLLKAYDNSKPIFLSGGITVDDVDDILNLKDIDIYAVDINSRFEVEPAMKNVNLIADFIQKVKKK